MAKLTKDQLKNQDRIVSLLEQEHLTEHDRLWILEHYQPSPEKVTKMKAHFTPFDDAQWVSLLTADHGHVVDVCAGIGSLSWWIKHYQIDHYSRLPLYVTAIEKDPDFVAIGKRLLPEIRWIEGDVFDPGVWDEVGPFDTFVTNPPFGLTGMEPLPGCVYKGNSALMVVEACLRRAEWRGGVAVLPQSACAFEYSGKQSFQWKRHGIDEFWSTTIDGCEVIGYPASYDTTLSEGYKDTGIKTEIVQVYTERSNDEAV